jgi:hypothetical protein
MWMQPITNRDPGDEDDFIPEVPGEFDPLADDHADYNVELDRLREYITNPINSTLKHEYETSACFACGGDTDECDCAFPYRNGDSA